MIRPTLCALGVRVPTVSSFRGIAVRIYFDDHQPPHFHVRHGSAEALIRIADGVIVRGHLPLAAKRLVERWRSLYAEELMDRWDAAQAGKPVRPIDPLERRKSGWPRN